MIGQTFPPFALPFRRFLGGGVKVACVCVCMYMRREERFLSARILIKSNSGKAAVHGSSTVEIQSGPRCRFRNLYYDTGGDTVAGGPRQPSRKRCIFIRGGS